MKHTKNVKSAITDRIKITKNGKLLRRKAGSGHFKTRKSSDVVRGKRKDTTLKVSLKKIKNY